MEVRVKGFGNEIYVVEVGVDDTAAHMRQKVASAVGLPEDGFGMSCGGEVVDEGDVAYLSEMVVLTMSAKQEAMASLRALGEVDITAERLWGAKDPKVACLLLQAEVATAIPHQFLATSSLTTLDLSAVSIVTHVGDSFLERCTSLTSIDLSGLRSVTHIGDDFLSGCNSLATLDLSPLSTLTHLGRFSLGRCHSLTTLDLSSLSSLTQMGDNFATHCTSLRTIYLWNCSSVVSSTVMNARQLGCMLETRPKRSREEDSPEHSHKRQRLSQ